jgi:hypothetical protein
MMSSVMGTMTYNPTIHIIRTFWMTSALLCAFAVVCEPSNALAENSPPTQIGNIYGGFDHQPTQSEVSQRERAAGINLDSNQVKRNSDIVDQLYRELENKAATGSPTAH